MEGKNKIIYNKAKKLLKELPVLKGQLTDYYNSWIDRVTGKIMDEGTPEFESAVLKSKLIIREYDKGGSLDNFLALAVKEDGKYNIHPDIQEINRTIKALELLLEHMETFNSKEIK